MLFPGKYTVPEISDDMDGALAEAIRTDVDKINKDIDEFNMLAEKFGITQDNLFEIFRFVQLWNNLNRCGAVQCPRSNFKEWMKDYQRKLYEKEV